MKKKTEKKQRIFLRCIYTLWRDGVVSTIDAKSYIEANLSALDMKTSFRIDSLSA